MATKTRIRVTGPLLRTWEEVDDRLRQIGLLDIQVEEIEADLQVRIAALKQEAAARAKPLQEQRIAETLARLKEKGLRDCIRVKEEVDKEALRDYPDEVLEAVGVTRKVEDTFFVEIDRARVKSVGDVSLV